MTVGEPLDYLVARLHDALVADPRLHEQGIEVAMVGERLALRGGVATPERRDAVLALVDELAPGIEVVDDLCITPKEPPHEAETL